MMPCLAFRRILLLAVMIGFPTIALAQTAAPPNVSVYFINLKDGDTVTGPFKIQFGLTGMGVAPAGLAWPNTGHHRLPIDIANVFSTEHKGQIQFAFSRYAQVRFLLLKAD